MTLSPGRKIWHVSAAASLCVLLASLSACSSGTSPSNAAPPASATNFTVAPWLSSAAAGPVKTVQPQGKRTLAAIVLRSSDLPASWKATPAQADTSDSQEDAKLATCVGGKNTSAADELANVDSDDFSVQGFTVSSSATLLKSKADIDADIAQLKRPKFASCFKALAVKDITASLPAGAKLGAISVVVHAGPHGAAPNVAGTLRAKIEVTVQSQKTTIYTDSAFISGPRIEAEVDYQGVGAPVSAALQAKLTAITARRCAQ